MGMHLAFHDGLAHAVSLLSLQLSQAHTSSTSLQILAISLTPLPGQHEQSKPPEHCQRYVHGWVLWLHLPLRL